MKRDLLRSAARLPMAILFAALTLLVAPSASFAGLDGTWKTSERVREDGQESTLTYTLILRRNNQAELITERSSFIRRSRSIDNDYGSIVTRYLRDDSKVTHRGTWSGGDDYVNISLSDISGRRDGANFSGGYEDGVLDLSCSNRGMYGRRPGFRFRKDGGKGKGGGIKTGDALAIGAAAIILGAVVSEESRKERIRKAHAAEDKDKGDANLKSDPAPLARASGEYIYTEMVSGSDGLKFRLALDRDGGATLFTALKGDPQATSSNVGDFGEILRMAVSDYRIEHSGRYTVNGDNVTINLKTLRSKSKNDDREVTLKGKLRGKTVQFENLGDTKLYGSQASMTFRATD